MTALPKDIDDLYKARGADAVRDAINNAPPIEAAQRPNSALPPWEDALALASAPPPLPPELIKGLLHQGAKLVLGGASKSNKTWSLLDMAVSVATGSEWWNLETVQGRVLYLNLEIAAPFFARRIKTVAEAKGVELQRGQFTVWNLRGHSCDIGALSTRILPDIKAGAFSLVILDPIYKCLGDRDENKAGEIASLLNQIEHIAVESGAAVAFGAHYSKGNQSAKESIDRIGGSGVFARDPDAILTLTAHTEEDAFTCEPTLRNHAPHDPFVLRWKWPLMRRDDNLDPAALKKPQSRTAKPTPLPEQVLALFRDCTDTPRNGLMTAVELRAVFRAKGWEDSAAPALRDTLEGQGLLKVWHGPHNQKLSGLPPVVAAYESQLANAGTLMEQAALPVSKPKQPHGRRRRK